MSEAITGLIQQTLQQTLENQSVKQQSQTSQTKPSFEETLQKTQQVESTEQTKTSGVQLQDKLDQLQTQLIQKNQSINSEQTNTNEISKELLDNKSRMSLLKEAYSEMGSPKMNGGFADHLVNLENSNKEIESIMKSDKNLSPGELLALQARLYQVSQHIEVTSKVVDQMAGGIKTVLNTNL